MKIFESILGYTNNAGATMTDLTAADEPFKVKKCIDAEIVEAFTFNRTVGEIQMSCRAFSSFMPLEFLTIGSDVNFLELAPFTQKVPSLENVFVKQSGSDGIDSFVLTLGYNVDSTAQRLISYNQFLARAGNHYSLIKSISIGSTPGWNGSGIIGRNYFRGNKDYAFISADSNNLGTLVCAAISGPDTDNYKRAVGISRQQHYRSSLLYIAKLYPDLPFIPVVNSENLDTTYLYTSSNDDGYAGTANVYLHFVELK